MLYALCMNTFWERAEALRKRLDLTQRQLSRRMGVNDRSVETWVQRNTMPNADQACIIAKALGTTVEFLVTGDDSVEAVEDRSIRLLEPVSEIVTPSGKVIEMKQGQDDVVYIPVLDQKLSAGKEQDWLVESYSGEKVPVLDRFVRAYPEEKLRAAEVRGDSMTGLQLFDSDLVFFVLDVIEGDGLYVLSLRGEVYVKRLQFNPLTNRISIISENKRYQPMEVRTDEESLKILGKVVGWLHRHPY